jgi:subtilisin family serine protease
MQPARKIAVPAVLVLLTAGVLASGAAGVPQPQAPALARISVGYAAADASKIRAFETSLGATTLASLSEIDADVIGVPSTQSATAIAALSAFPGVRYAQLDGRAFALGTPNDEFWPQEWSEETTDVPRAWDLTTGSPSVAVAVLDTGVDPTQPDLAGRVLPGFNFVDSDTSASDDNGHGTAVAGVIAAQGNDHIGTAGYCWQCRILPVKVLGSDGSGLDSNVAEGILWAVDQGAKVINASLGSLTDDLTLAAAAKYAAEHNVLLVAAAGNDGSATLDYPAALPDVLSVSASDRNDQPYSFSNTGAALAAPGENVTTGLDGSYVSFLGTSSAAPVVSGIAALGFAAAPNATIAQIAQALETTAVPSPGAIYGRVDAYGTLSRLAPQLTPAAGASPAPAASSTNGANSDSTRTRLVLHGRLTRRHPARRYTLKATTGILLADLSRRRAGVRIRLRLLTPDGTTVASRRSRRRLLRLKATVDSLRYQLVVSRRGAGPAVGYELALSYPTPDSTRR